MSGVEIRQKAASEGQRGDRRGKRGGPPLYIGLAGALLVLKFECPFYCLLMCHKNPNQMPHSHVSKNLLYE